jgi:hypothetical protein
MRVKWLRFLKRTNRIGDKIFPPYDLSDSQKKGIKIFEKALGVKEAEIFVSPLDDIIYVEINDIYLILAGNNLEIINGKFQYYLHFNDKIRIQLRSRVTNVLEGRRIKIEERIKSKNDRTLNSILEDIIEIKEKESK